MRSVTYHNLDATSTYAQCISRIRDSDLKRRLEDATPIVTSAADEFLNKAIIQQLYDIEPHETVRDVSGKEMVNVYVYRMAKTDQPGRPIYNTLISLPDDDRCPFCDHRNVSTLDHFLPKAEYPALAVVPSNLVGSCRECNSLKLNTAPTCPEDVLLHPYFDNVDSQCWLTADVIESEPAAVVFDVRRIDEWSEAINLRISNQFALLKLGHLYSKQAANEMANIRFNLQSHHDSNGPTGVRQELTRQWQSRAANRLNAWQTATYQALSESDWYCDGGFAAG